MSQRIDQNPVHPRKKRKLRLTSDANLSFRMPPALSSFLLEKGKGKQQARQSVSMGFIDGWLAGISDSVIH